MSEKLLPCPFCGSTDLEILPEDPSRDGNAWGAVQCVNVDCSTYDILKSHGVRVEDGQDVSDERGSDAYKSAAIAAWNRRTPAPEGALRIVPVEPTKAMLNAAIDVDPLKLGDISLLGFRISPQMLFERCWSAMLAASPVVPVGVSRETLLKAVRPVLDRHPMIDSSQSHKLDIQAGWVADAIIAALRPTDTGANHD
jgi:hypothetical protein